MKFIKDIARVTRLLPRKILWLSGVSIAFAFLSVCAEYVIASLIQIFTYHLQMIPRVDVGPFLKFLIDDVKVFFVVFISALILKGLVQFFLTMLNIIFAETFVFEVRKQLFGNIFADRSIWSYDLGFTSNLMSEVLPKASNFVTSVVRFTVLIIQVVTLGSLCLVYLPKEFLTSVVAFALVAPFILFLNKKSRWYGSFLLSKSEKLNRQLMTSIKNILFIRILGMQEKEKNSILETAKDYYDSYVANTRFYSMATTLPSTLGTILVFVLFYYFNSTSANTPGLLTLFYLLYRFIQYAGELVGITNGLSMYLPNFLVTIEILEQNKLTVKDLGGTTKEVLSTTQDAFDLHVEDVAFGHDPKKFIFENLNMKVKRGEILVLKGSSGSGKSTLLMNVLGIFKPSKGKIFWGEKNLENIPAENFRRHVGYVGAEPYIISGTIKDNICYGLHVAPSADEITRACNLAEMDAFLGQSSHGLETPLSEQGEGLSMGQKQRLGLARALLRKPEILVLDEITANLDKKTEAAVIENISKLKGKMTILVATHSNAFDNIADVKHEFKPIDGI